MLINIISLDIITDKRLKNFENMHTFNTLQSFVVVI